jgi:hypothetical protein
MDNRRLETLLRQGPIFLLLAAVAVFFWKVFTFAGVLFHFDLSAFNGPIRNFFFKNIVQGRFPLWSPELCGGFPLFDEGQMGPLYPVNYLLYTWLPAWYGLNVSALLHAFGGAAGVYFYLKRSHSGAAAALGGMLYVLGSPLVYHLIHLMFFETFCLLPWMFFFFDRFLEKGRISDVLGSALVLALMFTTGHQQGPTLGCIAFGVYALTLAAESWASGRRRIAGEITLAGLAIGVLAALSVCVIVLGIKRLLPESIRHDAMKESFIYYLSLVPDGLTRLASPAQQGHRGDLTSCLPGVPEKEVAVYLGLAVWCFAPLVFAGPLSRRERGHLAVVAFGLLFILGKAGPFTGLIDHIPMLNRMRVPTRFTMPMSLSFAFLAASGFDRLRRDDLGRRKVILLLLGGALAWWLVAWGGAFAAFGKTAFAASTPATVRHPHNTVEIARGALRSDLFVRTALAAALVAAALLLRWTRGKNPLGRWALTLAVGMVVWADLATAGRQENPVAKPALYRPEATLDFLEPRLDGHRIYTAEDMINCARAGWFGGTDSFYDATEGLPCATPALFGIRTMSCDSPLMLMRHNRAFAKPNVNWLRQTSVKYVLKRADKAYDLPKATTADQVRIFEVPDPPPMYGLATRVTLAATGDAAFDAVKALGDDVTTAVVESADESLLAAHGGGSVQVLSEEPDVRRLRVHADGPALLVVRENYYPGWRAAVDGRRAPLYRTNYLFSGVPLPAGDHDVTLTYRPAGFRAAMVVSLCTFFTTLWLALFYRPLRRPRPAFLDAPAAERIARLTLYAILAFFLALLLVAIIRHPVLWDFSHVRSPRWW